MASSRTRLLKELKSVQQYLSSIPQSNTCTTRHRDSDSPLYITSLTPNESNLYEWFAVIHGPRDTPYHGGVFRVRFRIPQTYPMAPPEASFMTTIFHPNVHFKTGEICLDILKNEWSPAWTILSVCQAIVALLSDPVGDSPLNCDAGNLLRSGDMRAYNGLARMYTVECASMD
jgi:peroxin-4